MRFGLHVTRFTWEGSPPIDGAMIRDIATSAEQAGLETLWASDHFYQHRPFDDPSCPMPEGFTWLTYAAAVTNSIELGALVAGVTHRAPTVLVKQVTTLDALSGGRALFGIGAAWNSEEHAGMGLSFPGPKERFERLEEALEIAKRMWTAGAEPFEGKHHSCADPTCSPGPVRQPHPPIVLGGSGKPRFLRLAVRYADVVNILFGGAENLPEIGEALTRACERGSRDPAEIELGTLRLVTPGADLVTEVKELEAAGAAHVIYGPVRESPLELIDFIGKELVPRFATS